jgi:nucleotide-binding universal stress UspA family protein
MPFLEKAKQDEIVMVAVRGFKTDEAPGADLAKHLARHGLDITLKRITSPEIDVASTVLSYTADTGADLIVMGGYGHSRLREFILGGTTSGILQAMTVPVLMSH